MSTKRPVLYGMAMSTCTRRCRMTLEEYGVDYDLVTVRPARCAIAADSCHSEMCNSASMRTALTRRTCNVAQCRWT